MSRHAAHALVVAAIAIALAGCADLHDLGVCGNGVVEPNVGEDCDGDGGGCVGCRLVCEPNAEHPDATCPEAGFQCGRDGICRKPSGYFALPAKQVDVPGDSLDTADVDFDGYADLIGFGDAGLGVVYGSQELDLARADAIPAPPPTRVDSQIAFLHESIGTDTPTHDVFLGAALPVVIGIAVMLNQGGTILALPVPGLIVVVDTIDVDSLEIIEGVIVLAGRLVGETDVRLAVLAENVPAFFPCDAHVTQLAVPPRAAHQRPQLDAIAVAPTATQICVYDQTTLTIVPPEPVAFAGSVTDMVFAQRGGDACKELILTKASGALTEIAASAQGGGHCAYGAETAVAGASAPNRVLAVGRQDSDQVDDLLLPDGILRGNGTSLGLPYSFTVGVIVDVNKDDRGDVVLGSVEHPDLDVLIQVAPDEFTHEVVRTGQPVAMLRTGDFDGDSYPDVIAIGAVPAGVDADVAALWGGPQGVTAPVAIAKLTDPSFAAAGVLTFTENLSALVTINIDPNPGGPGTNRTFSLFLGATNRGISSASILTGSSTRTVAVGPPDPNGGPSQLWEFSPSAGDNDCLAATAVCMVSSWITPGAAIQGTVTIASSFLRDHGPTSLTPWFVAATVGDAPAAVGVRRDGYSGTDDPSQLLIIPAPTTPEIVLQGRELDVLPTDVTDRTIIGVRAVEVDGDADSELLIVGDDVTATSRNRVAYLVSDPDAGSPALALTDRSRDDCVDAIAITGPDGAPLIVLACEQVGDQGAGLFAVNLAVSPPQLVRLGSLDHGGRLVAGDVNGDGLDDLVVHNSRLAGRAAAVATQCSHYHTAPCTGDQRGAFSFEAPE